MQFDIHYLYSPKRRTISLSVSYDGRITVRCPVGVNREHMQNFIRQKTDWINRQLAYNAERNARIKDFTDFKYIYVKGEKLPLFFGEVNAYDGASVCIKSLKELKKLYINCFYDGFLDKINDISRNCGLKAKNVFVKDYRSRWGCCSADNVLTFNYKTLMLPDRLQTYIIVHELCHTVQHNHSKRFYSLVAQILPDYKRLERELKNYDFITRLY